MMIVENRVAPLRRPVMIGEQRLESLRGFLALGADGAAINFDRQSLIVRQPVVGVQDERFAFHDNFLSALSTGTGAEIGRASCRERVCQYVLISVVAGSLKKKITKLLRQDIPIK